MNELDHEILQLEEHHPGNKGDKASLVLGTVGLTLTQYYQHLYRLMLIPEVVAMYPLMAGRLMRAREENTAARAGRRFELP